jgi:hypothetical protein
MFIGPLLSSRQFLLAPLFQPSGAMPQYELKSYKLIIMSVLLTFSYYKNCFEVHSEIQKLNWSFHLLVGLLYHMYVSLVSEDLPMDV